MSPEALKSSVGWQVRELREIGEIVTGSTPSKVRKEFYGGEFPFVKPGELLHCPVSDSKDRLSEKGALVADVAPAGSILVSCIGNLGKTGLATRSVAFNQQINTIIPHNADESKWIFYAVQSPMFAEQLAAVSSATTIAIVNKGKFLSLRIPVAPLPEQHRLVAEIEKQFSRLDEGVAALKRVQGNLKRYRAAVLKAACEGKLVPTEHELHQSGSGVSPLKDQSRDGSATLPYETGKQLLKRILAERRQKWQGRGKYKEPVALDVSDLPLLSEGWTWTSSSQILREVKDGTHDTPAYHQTGIPFITQKHIKPPGLVFEDYKLISKEAHERFYERSNPQRGDILVSMIGVNRGESCIVNNDEIFSIKNVGLFKPNHSLSSAKFIQHYMSSRLGQQLILKQSKGGAQPFIGLTELRAWPIPLPPFAEQKRIVEEVERRLSVIDELESVVSINLQRATRLRQAVLQKAFKGELT